MMIPGEKYSFEFSSADERANRQMPSVINVIFISVNFELKVTDLNIPCSGELMRRYSGLTNGYPELTGRYGFDAGPFNFSSGMLDDRKKKAGRTRL